MANEVAKKPQFTTALSQWTNEVVGLIVRDYGEQDVEFDSYSRECAMSAMSAIFQLVKNSDKVKDLNDIDRSNLRDIVRQCASLKLNPNASPRECYFQLRTKKVGSQYVQTVEMGIEGAGNDAILRNFGVDVKQVYPYWVVHEGDDFQYPRHKGVEVAPPEWEEKGISQKVIRVVYPVKLRDGSMQYLISERESVKGNLFAHVRNNLMNETFGIAESRYKATEKQKKEIDERKEAIYNALKECETLDDMIACEAARPYMSPAWLDSTEAMVTRKLCNNAVRRFPKSMNNMARATFTEMDETYKAEQEEIAENANVVDVEDPFTEGAAEE